MNGTGWTSRALTRQAGPKLGYGHRIFTEIPSALEPLMQFEGLLRAGSHITARSTP